MEKEKIEENVKMLRKARELIKYYSKYGSFPSVSSTSDLWNTVGVYVVLKDLVRLLDKNLDTVLKSSNLPKKVKEKVREVLRV